MSIDLNRLKSKSGERRVRDVITSGGDIVNIYEPTIQQIRKLGELQEKWIDDSTSSMNISGADMIRELFPMLTDIQGIENLSNDEINDIIDNPSNLFLQVQYALEAIIIETFSTVLKASKRSLVLSNFELQSSEHTEESYQNLLSYMTREHGEELSEFYQAIEQLKQDKELSDIEDLDRLLEENKNIINLEEIKKERALKKAKESKVENLEKETQEVDVVEPNSKADEYNKILNKYQNRFSDNSEPLHSLEPQTEDE